MEDAPPRPACSAANTVTFTPSFLLFVELMNSPLLHRRITLYAHDNPANPAPTIATLNFFLSSSSSLLVVVVEDSSNTFLLMLLLFLTPTTLLLLLLLLLKPICCCCRVVVLVVKKLLLVAISLSLSFSAHLYVLLSSRRSIAIPPRDHKRGKKHHQNNTNGEV